ncbi:MAG: D-alanyl-D-alanine carboxypeptidase [Kordiimonadaceae bacterium]|jgi:serine-type D-Ala-D-Ala carboxypeptidase (penicillin-binding protein 5/6)|nr:D-alanyl-D-alanine carboxypeptidase [Kordiimonadaceae bacterium]
MKLNKSLRLLALSGLAACLSSSIVIAQTMSSPAGQAILIEAATGDILFEKNANEQMTPSSMSKLMTVYIAFQQLKSGSLTLQDQFTVEDTPTWRRWRNTSTNDAGSTMYVNAGDTVTIEELLKGIIIQSGNDACAQLALAIAGDVGVFVNMMNDEAANLGLTGSNFMNTNGWPDENHYMTARDIATLTQALAVEFPDYYPMFAERQYEYAGVNQPNRNRLLYRMDGADGLKTGHTEAGGYGLASSASQGDRRLVLVVNGMTSDNARISESERLLNYGFRNFNIFNMLTEGQTVADADVWLGDAATVPLVAEESVTISMNRQARRNMTAKVIYDGPIAAPILKGQPIATLELSSPNMETMSYPLVAGNDVGEIGGFSRIKAAFGFMLMGSTGD